MNKHERPELNYAASVGRRGDVEESVGWLLGARHAANITADLPPAGTVYGGRHRRSRAARLNDFVRDVFERAPRASAVLVSGLALMAITCVMLAFLVAVW